MIVPVYNTATFLDECLHSVLNQTYQDLEIVLIDDGSTDSSSEMCDQHARADARIRVVHQDNAGLSEARNAGLRLASGGRVMFLDSDDWLHPRCVEVLSELGLRFDAQVALCGTQRVTDASEGSPTENNDTEPQWLSGDAFLRSPGDCAPVHPVSAWAKLIDSSILEGVEFPPGRLHEDVFTTHRFLHRATCIALTREPLHYYRQRPGSITAGPMTVKSAADKARAHLERASDLADYGLQSAAGLEFRRGLGWHLRVLSVVGRPSEGPLGTDLAEQGALIRRIPPRLTLDAKTRLALRLYDVAPRTTARVYKAAQGSSSGVHHIEGEADT